MALFKSTRMMNDWPGASVKAAFLKSTYSYNFDTQLLFSDVSSHEVTGTGYTPGGVAVSGKTDFYSGLSLRHDASDTAMGTLTVTDIKHIVLYNSVTGHLVQLFTLDTAYSPSGAAVTVQWPSDYLWSEDVVNV